MPQIIEPGVNYALDDNNNSVNDAIGYYSGDNSTAANRSQLVVTYQLAVYLGRNSL